MNKHVIALKDTELSWLSFSFFLFFYRCYGKITSSIRLRELTVPTVELDSVGRQLDWDTILAGLWKFKILDLAIRAEYIHIQDCHVQKGRGQFREERWKDRRMRYWSFQTVWLRPKGIKTKQWRILMPKRSSWHFYANWNVDMDQRTYQRLKH